MNVKHSVCRKWGKGGQWSMDSYGLAGLCRCLLEGTNYEGRANYPPMPHHIKLELFANSNPPLCPHLPIPLSPRSKNDKSIEMNLQLNQHTIIHVKIEKEIEREREKISISKLQTQCTFHMHRDNVCLIGDVKWPIYHVFNTSPPVHA